MRRRKSQGHMTRSGGAMICRLGWFRSHCVGELRYVDKLKCQSENGKGIMVRCGVLALEERDYIILILTAAPWHQWLHHLTDEKQAQDSEFLKVIFQDLEADRIFSLVCRVWEALTLDGGSVASEGSLGTQGLVPFLPEVTLRAPETHLAVVKSPSPPDPLRFLYLASRAAPKPVAGPACGPSQYSKIPLQPIFDKWPTRRMV